MPFCGAVLCGGASRRMGRDKALLPLDGIAMAVRVAEALERAGASDVFAVGGDAEALTRLGLHVVPDDEPGEGPFPATLTALRAARAPVVLVVSCDLVAPDEAAMRATVAALASSPAEVVGAIPVVEGHHQWTHAAWRIAGLPSLEKARMAGVGSLKRAAERLSLVQVTGLAPNGVRDADAPADLTARPTERAAGTGSLPSMDVPEIDVAELAELHAAGVALIDVREDGEWAAARVPGAQHIPLGQVAERIGDVPSEGTVYVICARGGRSAKAAAHYRASGIDAVNVAGGTVAWIDAGYPTDGGPESGTINA